SAASRSVYTCWLRPEGAPLASRLICQGSPSNIHQRSVCRPASCACLNAVASAAKTVGSLTPCEAPQPKSQAQLYQGTLAPLRNQFPPCQAIRDPAAERSARTAPPQLAKTATSATSTSSDVRCAPLISHPHSSPGRSRLPRSGFSL